MLIIGIAGGSGSGKTTFVNQLIKKLPKQHIAIICQDAYYKDNSHLTSEQRNNFNFDHPSCIDFDLLTQHIQELRAGRSIKMPIYSFLDSSRSKKTVSVHPSDILFVEGILIFSLAKLRRLLDVKLFMDLPSSKRLIRIIQRDTKERARTIEQVKHQYKKHIYPMHLKYIEPTKKYADFVLKKKNEKLIANQLIKQIKEYLNRTY